MIDAIEFGLTGQIGRLMGRGPKGLSLPEHGPHVEKSKFPDAAFVELPRPRDMRCQTRKLLGPGAGTCVKVTGS